MNRFCFPTNPVCCCLYGIYSIFHIYMYHTAILLSSSGAQWTIHTTFSSFSSVSVAVTMSGMLNASHTSAREKKRRKEETSQGSNLVRSLASTDISWYNSRTTEDWCISQYDSTFHWYKDAHNISVLGLIIYIYFSGRMFYRHFTGHWTLNQYDHNKVPSAFKVPDYR